MIANDTNDLLNRIKKKDVDAYLQLMSLYGGKIHTRLLHQIGDRNLADAVFQKTMVGFYEMLTEHDSEDAVETLLYFYADSVCQQTVKRTTDRPLPVTENQPLLGFHNDPPKEQKQSDAPAEIAETNLEQAAKSARPAGGAGMTLGIVLLVIGIVAVLWVILGLLMAIGILPGVDLGYSWFNNHIAHWF